MKPYPSIAIACLLLLLTSIYLNAQTTTWQRLYDGKNNFFDGGMDLTYADSNNVYLVGYTVPFGNIYKIWVLKIAPNGDTLWTRDIGQNGSQGYACETSNDYGCVVTGYSNQAFMTKLNSSGGIEWTRYYGGGGVQCYDILRTPDGGYISCGRSNLHDGYILKVDSTGTLQWQKVFMLAKFKAFLNVALSLDSGYVLSGYESPDIGPSCATVTKVNNFGDVIWERHYPEGGGGWISTVYNGYIVGGALFGDSLIGRYGFLNLDPLGNIRYMRSFDSTNYMGSLRVISPNRYVMAFGTVVNMSLFGRVVLCDSLGTVLKTTVLPAPEFIELKSLLIANNGDILSIGIADFLTQSDEDMYAVRFDSLLNTSPIVSISPSNSTIIDRELTIRNYPNPFNNSTLLEYKTGVNSHIKLELYDLSGRLVEVLYEGFKNEGTHTFIYEIQNGSCPSGIYLIKISSSTGPQKTLKIVLIK